jgi:hypothetical protein
VAAQVRDQVLGALLGEEDLCPVDLDDLACRAPDSRVAVAEERQAVEEFLARLLRP